MLDDQSAVEPRVIEHGHWDAAQFHLGQCRQEVPLADDLVEAPVDHRFASGCELIQKGTETIESIIWHFDTKDVAVTVLVEPADEAGAIGDYAQEI